MAQIQTSKSLYEEGETITVIASGTLAPNSSSTLSLFISGISPGDTSAKLRGNTGNYYLTQNIYAGTNGIWSTNFSIPILKDGITEGTESWYVGLNNGSGLALNILDRNNNLPTGSVSISGTPISGQTLTASNSIADMDGVGSITYTWRSNGVVRGTGPNYLLSQADVGKVINVTINYVDLKGTPESITSRNTPQIKDISPTPSLKGINGGLITFSAGRYDEHLINAAILTDQKILLLDAVSNRKEAQGNANRWDIGLIQISPNGNLDLNFDNDGKAFFEINGINCWVNTSAIQPDGKILVAAQQAAIGTPRNIILVRFNHDGSLDKEFGNDGYVSTAKSNGSDTASLVTILEDQKILVTANSQIDSQRGYFSIFFRYNPDGSIDDSFGNNGKVVTTTSAITEPKAIGSQSGNILTISHDSNGNLNINRFNSNGILDNGFGSGSGSMSVAGLNLGPLADVILQTDGRILVLGLNALARLNSDGTLDTGFGTSGKVIFNAPYTYYGINIQPDKKILICGVYNSGGNILASIERLNSDGNLDQTFGASGKSLFDVGDGYDVGKKVQTLPDGKIFLMGNTAQNFADYYDTFILRLTPDGNLDSSFARTNSKPIGYITINGTLTQGQTLSATDLLQDADGMGPVSYTWKSGSTTVGYGSNYTLKQSDVGKLISVTATYTDNYGAAESVSSSLTTSIANANDAPVGSIRVSGLLKQGNILTVSNDISDPDGIPVSGANSIKYQWQSKTNGDLNWLDIAGATSPSYALQTTAIGKTIRVKASYIDNFGTLETVYSDATTTVTNVNSRPGGKLSIAGTAKQNSTISVNNAIRDLDGIPNAGSSGSMTYTWLGDGAIIDGANSSTLMLTQSLVGKKISVNATYTDLNGTTETVTSKATAAVLNVNDLPAGKVTITGDARQNETLSASANLTDLDGLGTISYQWNANGKAIKDATNQTYTLTSSDVGKVIDVTASYTDEFNTKESVKSDSTAKVGNVNDLPTGTITITGSTSKGKTLTATNTVADIDGLGTFSYQWQSSPDGSNWSAISGATKSSYKLVSSDVSKFIRLKVSYTDKLGTPESVFSDSHKINNVNDKPVGVPTIAGNLLEGQTLTANTSKITDSDGFGAFFYLWQTSTDKTIWTDAGTSTTYQLGKDSAGQFVQLTVSYTDKNGAVEAIKSAVSSAIGSRASTLIGTDGSDTLVGMSGIDRITGGASADSLTGGAGKDIFVFEALTDSTVTAPDQITDFSIGDKIELKAIDSNTARASDQAFLFSTKGAAPNSVWWDSASNTLFGDIDGNKTADFAIKVSLVGLAQLQAADIAL